MSGNFQPEMSYWLYPYQTLLIRSHSRVDTSHVIDCVKLGYMATSCCICVITSCDFVKSSQIS